MKKPFRRISVKKITRKKSSSTQSGSRSSSTSKQKKQSSHKKRLNRKKIVKILAITAGVFFIAGLIGIGSVFAYFAKDLPDPEKLIERNIATTTRIYDRSGEKLLYEIHGDQNRTLANIDDLPDYVRFATIAVEDNDFYNHRGFDMRGIARALFVNFTSERGIQGGSTITQQLIKNAVLTPERTYTRKIKEVILSIQLERKFSKDEILQLYLNEIPYGSNAYGIHAASKTYFEKAPQDLTISEAALLASLPKAPTYYSPYGNNIDKLKQRHEWSITRMEELGYITKEEAESARKEEIKFSGRQDAGIIAPHFVFYIREKLEEKYGTKTLEQGGLTIITSLDYDKQLKAERVVSDHIDHVKKYGASNIALTAIDPKTGEILAMVGSKDYFNLEDEGNVNAAASLRQPGSSFKPYVYATAFEKGYTPETIVFDLVTDFGDGYKPQNYDKSQHGPIRLKDALARSLNIPAVKMAYMVDPAEVATTARKMGIEDLPEGEYYGPSTGLGAKEIKLVDHVGAFGVFANQGKKISKTGVLRVTDGVGKILEEHNSQNGDQVIGANTANTINNILSNNSLRAPTFGSNSPLNLSRASAAKTGTTNDFKDAWTVGYTPNLVAGVWAGNNDGTNLHQGADGIFVASPIWHAFMEDALQGMPTEDFVAPSPIETQNPYLKGLKVVEKKVKLCKPSMKLATANCPPDMIEEKIYKESHSILHYVDRKNPNGPSPKNPREDPLYSSFEGPVRAWLDKNGETFDKIPTEEDDFHNPDKKPIVNIASPQHNSKVEIGTITIAASVKAPLGVQKVEFFMDKTLIQTDATAPYSTFYTVNTNNGFHAIRVRATDIAGNSGETTITVNISVKKDKPSVKMLAPAGTALIPASAFPYTLSASVSNISNLASVTFYFKRPGGGSTIIGSITSPTSSGQYNMSWGASPGVGSYEIYANATDSSGNVTRSNSATLTVQ